MLVIITGTAQLLTSHNISSDYKDKVFSQKNMNSLELHKNTESLYTIDSS
jgi:hypothetical protein